MSEVGKQKLKKIWQKLWKNHYQSMSEKERQKVKEQI